MPSSSKYIDSAMRPCENRTNTKHLKMKTLKEILFKPVFFSKSYRTCRAIEIISAEEVKKFGVEKQIKVLHFSNRSQEIFLVQIFSKGETLRKAKIIALLSSLIVKKTALEMGVQDAEIKVILNVVDPLMDSLLIRTDRLNLKNIEYLINDSLNQKVVPTKDEPTKVEQYFNKVVVQTEPEANKSESVSEIDFEEYLNVAKNKLRTIIAEKREEQRNSNQII
jgi:hypothetical protein